MLIEHNLVCTETSVYMFILVPSMGMAHSTAISYSVLIMGNNHVGVANFGQAFDSPTCHW